MVLPGETLATGAPRRCDECDQTPALQVCRSNAGYYVGTMCGCGPYSRESEYYRTSTDAQSALDTGEFGR